MNGYPLSRRTFVKIAGATALAAAAVPIRRTWAQTNPSPLIDLPGLDGELLLDETGRRSAASDLGGHVRRMPVAVLRPKSAKDVLRGVAYANKRRLRIAMRGRGHSLYGQSQVEGGIVIDSSTLNAVQLHGNDALDVQPGALWSDVVKAALPRGLTPPVMVDSMILSVGGTLSVGGIGEMSHRYGAQVDHVLELDVVTGAGDLVTCSPEFNGELFHMLLAGVGQCGIIVRARLRLISAPKYVAMRTFAYDDIDSFLADQAGLAAADGLGPMSGQVTRDQAGRARYHLHVGNFVDSANDAGQPAWLAGLSFKSEERLTIYPYWDNLSRPNRGPRLPGVDTTARPGAVAASLVVTLPPDSTKSVLAHVLGNPDASIGMFFFEISAKIPARHTRPLQKMPQASVAFELRMMRRADVANAPDHRAMLAANHALLPRLQAAGGKVYPPFCPILSQQQWHEHYGAEIWQRFAAAKKRFDPNGVLTPGAGIFNAVA